MHDVRAQAAIGLRVAQDLGGQRLAIETVVARAGLARARRVALRLEGVLRHFEQGHDLGLPVCTVGVVDHHVVFHGDGVALGVVQRSAQKSFDLLRRGVDAFAVACTHGLIHRAVGHHFRRLRRGTGMQQGLQTRGEVGFEIGCAGAGRVGEADEQAIKVGLHARFGAVEIGRRQYPFVALGIVLHHGGVAAHLLEREMQKALFAAQRRAQGVNGSKESAVLCATHTQLGVQGDSAVEPAQGIGRPGMRKRIAVHGGGGTGKGVHDGSPGSGLLLCANQRVEHRLGIADHLGGHGKAGDVHGFQYLGFGNALLHHFVGHGAHAGRAGTGKRRSQVDERAGLLIQCAVSRHGVHARAHVLLNQAVINHGGFFDRGRHTAHAGAHFGQQFLGGGLLGRGGHLRSSCIGGGWIEAPLVGASWKLTHQEPKRCWARCRKLCLAILAPIKSGPGRLGRSGRRHFPCARCSDRPGSRRCRG